MYRQHATGRPAHEIQESRPAQSAGGLRAEVSYCLIFIIVSIYCENVLLIMDAYFLLLLVVVIVLNITLHLLLLIFIMYLYLYYNF